jgi:hypothetical protein
MGSHGRWDDCDIAFTIIVTIKHGRFKCIKYMNIKDELYNVPTCCTKFLKYDSSWHRIESICLLQPKKNLIEVKVQGAPNALDYYITSAFGCNFRLVQEKVCYKSIAKLKV